MSERVNTRQVPVPGSIHAESDPKPGTVEAFYESVPGEIVMWTGALGSPGLWMAMLQVNYGIIRWVCFTGNTWVLHLSAGLFLLLSVACGILSWWNWKRIGAGWPVSSDEGIPARTRLLAVIGMLATPLFSLLIALQGTANFIFNPCEN